MAIKILTDSGSDITAAEAEKLGIKLLSMSISFGSEEYYDGETLMPSEFYVKLQSSHELPKTSQITQFRFEEAFEELVKNEDEVIAITLSSKLSATHNNAVNAAERFGGRVLVVDSFNACLGQRLLCLYALQLVEKGLSAQEIVEKLEIDKHKIRLFAMIGTLEYLKKGGRISSAVAVIGGMLSIKPIIEVTGGEVKVISKAIGFKKGLDTLSKLSVYEVDKTKPYGMLYSGTDESLVDKYVSSQNAVMEKPVDSYALGSTIGTHIGPGAVGFAYFSK